MLEHLEPFKSRTITEGEYNFFIEKRIIQKKSKNVKVNLEMNITY
jgi:hypothetical protein